MKVTETKTTILETKDGSGPRGIYLSIIPLAVQPCHIDLVVGAQLSNRSKSLLDREGLGELIKILQEVHDAML